ncbi:alpha/beta hydrolase [Archangium violaceum]|uniref:alpha/beta fold hydrolase n=1 Tax=Archangium violaceum TaxID=83451 RepID=UPI00194FCFC8|nr:alpha/beta hydrolase [Archangium violaceum]QRN97121.1 alpha/beta hydrolase [Archangium violaceum]
MSRWILGLFVLTWLGCATTRTAAPGSQEPTTTIEGGAGQLRVSDGGSGGIPVVFVHGLGSNLEAWSAQLDHVRASRRAVAYDQRGHGGSQPARDGVYTIEALAEDLDQVVRTLGIERFVLVGHSMAGEVITAYAERHPEKLAGLVYVDAVGDVSQAPPEVKAWFTQPQPDYGPQQAQAEFQEMLGPNAKPKTREQVLASVARVEPATILAIRRAMGAYAPGPGLARYTGPRVAIDAEGPHVPFMAAHSIPEVTRVTLPNVSHWLMMDDPEGFNRALDPVLDRAR